MINLSFSLIKEEWCLFFNSLYLSILISSSSELLADQNPSSLGQNFLPLLWNILAIGREAGRLFLKQNLKLDRFVAAIGRLMSPYSSYSIAGQLLLKSNRPDISLLRFSDKNYCTNYSEVRSTDIMSLVNYSRNLMKQLSYFELISL